MVLKTIGCWLLSIGLLLAQPRQLMSQQTPQRVFDFMKGNVPAGFSMIRSGSATRYNASGYVESVAANTPRITYDPVSLTCNGMLLEESRTNQLTNSDNFTDWTLNHVTLTANAGTGPDGTNSAIKMSENNNTEYHYLSRSVSYNSGNTYTYSAFVKAGTRTVVSLQMQFSGSGYGGGNVDLTTGAVTTTFGGASVSQFTISSIRNGWYRIAYTSVNNGNGGENIVLTIRQNGTQDAQYQGDGSYIYVWGAQFEQGAFHTSYIPTQGSSVTRGAEVYSASTSGWYNQTEGTFHCRFFTDAASSDLRPLTIWDGTNNNRFAVQRNTSNQLGGFGVSGGTAITYGVVGNQATGPMSVAFSYRGTEYRMASNNTLLALASNTVTPPPATTMTNVSSGRLWLQRIIYWPRRLGTPYLQFLSQ